MLKATGERFSLLRGILAKFGINAKKEAHYLEFPAYNVMAYQAEMNNTHISWAARNLGVPHIRPLSGTHHSFFVHTKGEKKTFIKSYNLITGLKLSKEENSLAKVCDAKNSTRTPEEAYLHCQRIAAMIKVKLADITRTKMQTTTPPAQIIQVDNLAELGEKLKHLDY